MIYGSVILECWSEKHFRYSAGRGVVHTRQKQSMFIRAVPPVLVITGSWSQSKTGRVIIIMRMSIFIISAVGGSHSRDLH